MLLLYDLFATAKLLVLGKLVLLFTARLGHELSSLITHSLHRYTSNFLNHCDELLFQSHFTKN